MSQRERWKEVRRLSAEGCRSGRSHGGSLLGEETRSRFDVPPGLSQIGWSLGTGAAACRKCSK
jgi:hypothetical protein